MIKLVRGNNGFEIKSSSHRRHGKNRMVLGELKIFLLKFSGFTIIFL